MELKNRKWMQAILAIRNHPIALGKVILFDIIMIVGFYALWQLDQRAVLALGFGTSPLQGSQLFIAFMISVLYQAGIIFAFSFFRLQGIKAIGHSFHDTSKTRIKPFFILNALLYVGLALLFIILAVLAADSRASIQAILSLLILLLFAWVAYALVNGAHVATTRGRNLKEAIITGARATYRIQKNYGIVIVLVIATLATSLVTQIMDPGPEVALYTDFTSLFSYGSSEAITFTLSILLIYYIAFLYNRFYWYALTR